MAVAMPYMCRMTLNWYTLAGALPGEEMKVFLEIDHRQIEEWRGQEVQISGSVNRFFIGHGNVDYNECEQRVTRALFRLGLGAPNEVNLGIKRCLSSVICNKARTSLEPATKKLVIMAIIAQVTLQPQQLQLFHGHVPRQVPIGSMPRPLQPQVLHYIPVPLFYGGMPRQLDQSLTFDEIRVQPRPLQTRLDDDDEYLRALQESLQLHEQMGFRATPTTAAAIEASLETLNFEQGMAESNSTCSVCLDQFILGMQLKRMPCMHLFHRDCIVTWLKESNSCPLCRFKIQDHA